MEVALKENERIDDLERNGYRIIQNRTRFCFGMDAVLLSGFVCEGEKGAEGRIADLGTGTGIIPLLLHGKLGYCAGPEAKPQAGKTPDSCSRQAIGKPIIGLEIQEEMTEMAGRSVQLNGLEHEIGIVQGDLCKASSLLGRGCFDVVTSNPPYRRHGGGISNPDPSKAISRHEILCTFEDVAREAALLLKPGGRFYLVHRPDRLPELMETMRRYRLEPKRLRMVHSFAESSASMVLMEALKGGNPFLKVEKPLIIYREPGQYTEEILQIYHF